jgi:LPXTG-site transpeptidase (sortase) family protein
MSSKNYFDAPKNFKKKVFQQFIFVLMCMGFLSILYIFFPLILWEFYIGSQYSKHNNISLSSHRKLVTDISLYNLFKDTTVMFTKTDYYDVKNWYPKLNQYKNSIEKINTFLITIPKINITNAKVSTADTSLKNHLVHFPGTALPPQKGNTIIFGYSQLPQNQKQDNYKNIFNNLYLLQKGDEIIVNYNNSVYKYMVENILVTDPDETSELKQDYNYSFLTLVTLTPPGTIWKRLVIKARIINNL